MGLRKLFSKKTPPVSTTFIAPPGGSELVETGEYSDFSEGARSVLEALRSAGDDPNIVRPILHYCYFKKKKDLKEFVGMLETLDIQHEPTKMDLGVIVITASSTIEEEILPELKSMSNAVKMCNGEYDGWETQPMGNENEE